MTLLRWTLRSATVIFLAGLPSLLDAKPCHYRLHNQPAIVMEGPFRFARGHVSHARDVNLSDETWKTIQVPFRWQDAMGSYRGEIWLRCSIELTGPAPTEAGLQLRHTSDADEVYFNGIRIGRTGSFTPFHPVFSGQRLYMIPQAAWKQQNVLAIRLSGSSVFSGMRSAPVLLREAASQAADGHFRFQAAALSFSLLYIFFAIFFAIRGWVTLRLREHLIFAAFCALFGLYQMIRNGLRYELFDLFTTSFAVELLLLIPLPFLFLEFFLSWTEQQRPRSILYLEAGAALLWILTAGIPLLPEEHATTLLHASLYINLLILCSAVIVGIRLAGRIYSEQRHRLRYLTVGFYVLLPFVVHDVLVTAGLLSSPSLFVFAFPVFLITFAVQLAQNEQELHRMAQQRNNERKLTERRKAEALFNVSREFQHHFDGIRNLTAKTGSDRKLKRHITSLKHLLDDARLLSELEEGTYEVSQSRFDIGEQVRLVVNEVQTATNEKASRFTLELPPDSERFWSDLDLFQACVYHIVENAVIHSTGRIVIRAEVMNDILHLVVRDEGPGISVDAQDRIFEKFYRGSGVKAPGSGIGLTIVDLAIQRLQGSLHVESGPGFFTTFHMELPELQEVIQ